MKECNKCKQVKETSSFAVSRAEIDGLQRTCRKCAKAIYKAYKENQKTCSDEEQQTVKDRIRETKYKMKYGLTLEQFDKMREEQDYRCYICSSHEVENRHKVLYIDHDHDTGEVRKLLCSKCNQGLGLFNDSSGLLAKAAKYLETYGKP